MQEIGGGQSRQNVKSVTAPPPRPYPSAFFSACLRSRRHEEPDRKAYACLTYAADLSISPGLGGGSRGGGGAVCHALGEGGLERHPASHAHAEVRHDFFEAECAGA